MTLTLNYSEAPMKSRILPLILTGFLVPILSLLIIASTGSAASTADWWNGDWPYRVPIEVNAAGYARNDKPVEVSINFTTLLQTLGEFDSFDSNSIRVIEVDNDDNPVDADVPFQFDIASNYDATSNAAGTLVFLLTENTSADETRRFHVYFDVAGGGHSLPLFTDHVTMTSITDAYDFDTYKIVTSAGTYHYHKSGGGFASLIDSDAKDWIAWNTATGNAGDFRGIPNMLYPTDGGYFHPGRTTAATTLIDDGPLRASFKSVSEDGKWEVVWDVFPTSARMTVLKVDATKKYWLQYEGTPGGVLEPATDLVTRSDGTQTTAATKWEADITGEEWVYFTDPALSRSLFMIHHQEDELPDLYRPSTPDAVMTVFGFGRSGSTRHMTATNQQLSFGLVNEAAFNDVRDAIHDTYKPLGTAIGAPVSQTGPTPTATVPTPTATVPTPTATVPTPTATVPTPTATVPTPTATVPTPTATTTATSQYLIYMGGVFK